MSGAEVPDGEVPLAPRNSTEPMAVPLSQVPNYFDSIPEAERPNSTLVENTDTVPTYVNQAQTQQAPIEQTQEAQTATNETQEAQTPAEDSQQAPQVADENQQA